jgi:2'-5' RNA ligase
VARLFIAAWLPDDVLDRVASLRRPEEPGVRYTRRDQWHITLRFLGEAEVGDAVAALDQLCAPTVTAELGPAVSRLGRNVVCVPVHGLEELAAKVAAVTAAIGEPPDPRPFAGHVTIARLRHRGSCRIAGEPISARFTVTEVHLVESIQRAGGVEYETRSVVSLG